MSKNQLVALFGTVALTLSTAASAAVMKDVQIPDQVTVGKKSLVLNGLGMRQATMFKVDVYIGALYLEAKSADAQQILASSGEKQITLAFVRNLDREKLVNAFSEGLKENCEKNCDKFDAARDAFFAMVSEVKKGDRLTITFLPDRVQVVNTATGKNGEVASTDFSRALLAVWLGKHPPTEDLQKGMLGQR